MNILNQTQWTDRKVKVTQQSVFVNLDNYCDPKRRQDEFLGLLQPKFETIIGIDPGNTNLGITILQYKTNETDCFELTFPSERLAISRVTQIRLALADLFFGHYLIDHSFSNKILVSVESSAFSMPFRNTELAEARITEAMWFVDTFEIPPENCRFIPPNTIRKQVFGNGKLRAEDQWPELKPDAASSL